ncbi:unnamed protein product [Candidula unifasciata]|uniref:Major facilitator superfamily (MFS) profile domain-containing protein n=1 Tax=Candidula unifasciata TaxID=100452 RepID=A0A8S3ZPL0_9EUPU|nr:unnamed protein product [Candidula unifasciata]
MAENGQLAEEYHPQQTPAHTFSPPLSPLPSSCSINRRLLPVKGYYFVFMAAVGDLLPFIGIYMLHLGLTTEETGLIYGVMPFIGFFVRPLIGALSDKYKKHKLVLILVTAFSGIFYFLLVFVPHRPSPAQLEIHTNFACSTQNSYFHDCPVTTQAAGCSVGLTYFANSTETNKLNKSLSCSVSCQAKSDATIPDFRYCFTNNTGEYGSEGCTDTSYKRVLRFTVPDLQGLIASEIIEDRETTGSAQCLNYDVKDILFGNTSKREALQILCGRALYLDCALNCDKNHPCETSPIFRLDTTFCVFFVIFLMANIAFAPVFPLLDAAAYDNLGQDRHLWGQQRVWGTFGFILFAVTSTFIMDMQKRDGKAVDYSVSIYLFLPLTLIAAFIASFLNMSGDIRCGHVMKNITQLLKNAEVSAFLFVVMYFGMLTGALEAFLFWFLTTIGSSPLVFGFILLINCCAEVPMLWIAGTVIKKIGLVSCLYLAFVCYGIRLIVYSFIYEPWLALLVEPLYGVCFGLMYAAASSYASIIAPPGMSATVQGLLGGVHFGFGKGLGSLITGFMFRGIGPRWTWRVYVIISAIILVVYFCLNKFVFKSDHRQLSRPSAATGHPDDQAKQEVTLIKSNLHSDGPEITL